MQKDKRTTETYRYTIVLEEAYYKRGANKFEEAHLLQNSLDRRRESTIVRDTFLISDVLTLPVNDVFYFTLIFSYDAARFPSVDYSNYNLC